MLNLGRLRVLCEVVSRGSFSGAAESLAYTQSAVSQAIARLEAETGAELVVRDRRGVRPTAAGATLIDHAEAIFAQVEAAEADLDAVLGIRAGRLRVASFPSAGATLMPAAVATFRERHPGVELTLAEGEPEEIGPRLSAGEFDIALLFEFEDTSESLGPDIELTLSEGEPEEIAPRLRAGEFDLALLFEFPGVRERPAVGLRAVALLEDPMHVALPAAHPLASKPAVKLEDLRDEDWVQTSAASPCAKHVVRSCVGAGFEPHVTFESDDYETVQGLVAAGVGVALIPRLALTRVHEGIVVRELAPRSPARKVLAATVPGAGAAPAAKTMIRILIDVAGPHAARPGSAHARIRGSAHAPTRTP